MCIRDSYNIEILHPFFLRHFRGQNTRKTNYCICLLYTSSTLTELDTPLLFDEGVTAKGKPLVYHLMHEDLKKAYELAKEESAQNAEITPVFLQKLNAALLLSLIHI